jgi:hypothetical protein
MSIAELAAVAEAVAAAAVVVGLLFAGVQLRQYRRTQEREAALAMLHSFQTPTLARALLLVFALPEGLSKAEVEARFDEGDEATLYTLLMTWESLGILVYRGQVELALVDDFFSGPIVLSWRKLRRYIEEQRAEQGRETIEEWFQWLAERMAERESRTPPVPAHVEHRRWRPRA